MTTLNLILFVLFKHIIWLQTYGNWLNRTFVVWITSIAAIGHRLARHTSAVTRAT